MELAYSVNNWGHDDQGFRKQELWLTPVDRSMTADWAHTDKDLSRPGSK